MPDCRVATMIRPPRFAWMPGVGVAVLAVVGVGTAVGLAVAVGVGVATTGVVAPGGVATGVFREGAWDVGVGVAIGAEVGVAAGARVGVAAGAEVGVAAGAEVGVAIDAGVHATTRPNTSVATRISQWRGRTLQNCTVRPPLKVCAVCCSGCPINGTSVASRVWWKFLDYILTPLVIPVNLHQGGRAPSAECNLAPASRGAPHAYQLYLILGSSHE